MILMWKKYLPIKLLITLIFTSQAWSSSVIEDHSSRTGFAQKILTLTQAERDLRLEAQYHLSQALASSLNRDKLLEGQWNHLWTVLKEPEALVNKEPYIQFITNGNASLHERILSNFRAVTHHMDTFKDLIQTKGLLTPNINEHFMNLTAFYKAYQGKIQQRPNPITEGYFLIEPKALLMGDLWPSEFYRISQRMARYLLQFDEHGNIISNHNLERTTSNHRVSFLPHQEGETREVYFKVNGMPALNPGREYMLSSLYQKLDVQAPSTGLLILDHVKKGESYSEDVFVIQASQAIQGLSGKRVLKEKMALTLDPEHYSRQVIGSLLTSPIDGKADNYIVTSLSNNTHGWVSIDNEEVFQPPIRRDNSIHLKSALFLLPEMDQPIVEATYKYLSTLVPEMLLLEWMEELQAQEQRYIHLKQALTFHGLKRKGGSLSIHHINELWDQLSLPFTSFNPSILPTLRRLLTVLQTSLKTNTHATLQELFAACYPTIGASYHALRQEHLHDPYAALRVFFGIGGVVKRALPLNGEDLERDYFKEGEVFDPTQNTLSQHKNKLLSLIQDSYGSRFVDAVMESYRAKSHARLPFINQALRSFKVLASENLTTLQTPKLATEVYVKGLNEIQALPHQAPKDKAKQAWHEYFTNIRKINAELHWLLTLEEHFPQGWSHQGSLPTSHLEIKGAFMGRRMLSSSMATAILNKRGKFKRDQSLPGRAETARYPKENPLFYFKKYPEIPAYEYAATSFMRRLGMRHIPRSELLIFHDPQEGLYPVLLTEAISGKLVCEIWQNDDTFNHLDPMHTNLLMIASMLLNPEDQKEDNFILSPDNKYLIPIDNDHAFLPGAIQVKGFWKIYPQLQTKTLAFCLKEMNKPLSSSLIQTLITLNVDQFLQQWMKDLCNLQDAYNILPSQTAQLWNKKNVTLRLPLSSLYIEGLYRKFHLIQKLLTIEPTITPLDLLSKIEPYTGKHYIQAFPLSTLRARFDAATESLYQNSNAHASPRVSVQNSRRLFEIIDLSDKELMSQMTSFRSGPVGALEQLVKLQEEHQDPNSLVQKFLREETTERIKLRKEEEQERIKDIFETNRPYDVLEIPYSSLLKLTHFQTFEFLNKGPYITVSDLRGAQHMREEEFMALQQACPNLLYLNISKWGLNTLAHLTKVERNLVGWIKIQETSKEPYFKQLERLIASHCSSLNTIDLFLPNLKSLEISHNEKLDSFSIKAPLLRFIDIEGTKDERMYGGAKLEIDDYKQINFKGFQAKFSIQECFKEGKLTLPKESLKGFFSACYLTSQLKRNSNLIESIVSLNLDNTNLGNSSMLVLLSNIYFPNLTSLSLAKNYFGDGGNEGIEFITNSKKFSNLTYLNLEASNITNFFKETMTLSKLEYLELRFNKFYKTEDSGADAILQNASFSNLTYLSLMSSTTKLPNFSKLRHLGLYTDNINYFISLVQDTNLINLTSLEISGKFKDVNNIENLVNSPYFTKLKSLTMDDLAIAKELIKSRYLTNLLYLDFNHCCIGSERSARVEQLKFIVNSPNIKNLVYLNLRNCYFDCQIAKSISSSPYLTNLLYLYLYGNDIGCEGVKAISNSIYLINLLTLDVRNNNLSVDCQKILKESKMLTKLKNLYF